MIRKSWKVLVILTICATLAAFARPGTPTECLQLARLKASDPDPFDSFGRAVSIWGDTVVVGAFWDDQNGLDSGAAYIFARENQNWVQKHKLLSSDGITDPEKARKSIGIVCRSLRSTGVTSFKDFRALEFNELLVHGGTLLAGLKEVLALYGLDLNAWLDSVKAETVFEENGKATVNITYRVFGQTQETEADLEFIDGHWFTERQE